MKERKNQLFVGNLALQAYYFPYIVGYSFFFKITFRFFGLHALGIYIHSCQGFSIHRLMYVGRKGTNEERCDYGIVNSRTFPRISSSREAKGSLLHNWWWWRPSPQKDICAVSSSLGLQPTPFSFPFPYIYFIYIRFYFQFFFSFSSEETTEE